MKRIIIFLAAAMALFGCKENNPVLTIEGGQVQGIKGELKGVTVF